MGTARKKVVVAMSGGVDSSVAAALLLREGYDVMGVFMRLGSPKGVEPDEPAGGTCDSTGGKNRQGCCSVLDADDARRVAGMLGIPFYVLNFEDDFGRVIDYFVDEYNRGRTPNPCVRCNDWLKFGKLARYAEAVGADYVASGHYARVGVDGAGRKVLMRGLDSRKDQSYVLFGVSRAALEHTLLPVGGLEKPEVRAIAEDMKLPVFNKPDSQEICFVPNQDYAALVKRRTPDAFREGELVTAAGERVGTHAGHQHFTVGQRKGIGVGGRGVPLYVLSIDPASNRVTVGEKEALYARTLTARQLNVLSPALSDSTGAPVRCTAKIRYNHAPQPATARVTGPDELRVTFDDPQSAITPGQAVVLYDGDVVLGGGWIETAALPTSPLPCTQGRGSG
jgi:tRNA-specific 2-thiouridylase